MRCEAMQAAPPLSGQTAPAEILATACSDGTFHMSAGESLPLLTNLHIDFRLPLAPRFPAPPPPLPRFSLCSQSTTDISVPSGAN